MAESILFSGWLASLMLIVSVSLAGYWVVGIGGRSEKEIHGCRSFRNLESKIGRRKVAE
jgi:hypothetical protein